MFRVVPKYFIAISSESTSLLSELSTCVGCPCNKRKPKKLKKFESTSSVLGSKNWLLPALNLYCKLNTRQADFTTGNCFGNCAPKAIPDGACENVSLSLLKVFTMRKISLLAGWKLS